MYKKPQTEKVALETGIRCQGPAIIVGSCGEPVSDIMGAPIRFD